MRVLVLDAYDLDDPDRHVVDAVEAALEALGNEVERRTLVADGFARTMSAGERRVYETDEPLATDETRSAAGAVKAADAVVCCYPTRLFGVPASLKSWFERVLVLGVAFEFDRRKRIRPALTNVRRLGVVTTTPHGRVATFRARDLGRRTIMWTLRLNCHRFCRRSHLALPQGVASGDAEARITRSLRRWT